MQVHDQPALQAGADAVLEILDLTRCAISRDDDLLIGIHERVECVEELFLRAVFARDELHVVDHQHINGAEELFEVHHLALAQRSDEAVHELLGREVEHIRLWLAGAEVVRDGMHQVGLTQADATIKEQRVECDRATFSDAAGCGVCQFVGFADNEAVEGKAWVDWAAVSILRRFRLRFGFLWRGRGQRTFRHIKAETLDVLLMTVELIDDLIAEVLFDVVADEPCWNFECRDAVVQRFQFQWSNPVFVTVRTHSRFKCF